MNGNELSSLAFRIAYRNVVVVGLITLVLVSVLSSWANAFSLGCGLIIGLSPFISWHLISRLFIAKPQASRFLKTALMGLGLLKLALVGVILYLLFSLECMTAVPFIIGMVLIHPIVIGTVLRVKSV